MQVYFNCLSNSRLPCSPPFIISIPSQNFHEVFHLHLFLTLIFRFSSMFSRKHYHHTSSSSNQENEHHPHKNKEFHTSSVNPFIKYFFVFLVFWFLLLFFRLTPTKFNSSDQEPQKLLSKPAPPVCDENISIYVYNLPTKFNLGLLQDCKHLNVYTDMCPHVANHGLGQHLPELGRSATSCSWFATHQFIAEMIFHARIENHPCRSWDPEKANLLYVPFYGGLHASSKFRESDHKERDALAVELSEYMMQQRWWQRRKGKDHFVALGRTAWDFMRTNNGPDFGANRLLYLPALQNMSVLTVERHPWQGTNQHGIPYPSYFHPSTSDEMVAWQKKIAQMDRLHLFSFVGGPRTGVKKATIRDEIIRQCVKSSRCKLLKCGQGGSKCHKPEEVLSVMSRSQFCLQAPGDSFTRRSTFDAVLASCIPVFFSTHTAYSQYRWYFPEDPTEYSVFIDAEGNASKKIEDELMRIPLEKVKRMRIKLISLIPSVTYNHPNSTDYGFPDAVDISIAALAQQIDSMA